MTSYQLPFAQTVSIIRLMAAIPTPPKPEKEEIKVFISNRDSTCDECSEDLGKKAWITLVRDIGALCLSCADLDHLVFLASGDAALTRRARKYSRLSAVVLKFSRARRRYERQGLLVEETALDLAEEECLADFEVRELRKEREAERRAGLDEQFVQQFAHKIRELFPRIETGRDQIISEHACRKYTGRVGRSAAAKSLDENAILLAVIAHIRHRETNYDELLGRGWERSDARGAVAQRVDEVLSYWEAVGSQSRSSAFKPRTNP